MAPCITTLEPEIDYMITVNHVTQTGKLLLYFSSKTVHRGIM